MNTKNKVREELDYQHLQDELERRYGPGAAQDLMDQIRRLDEAYADVPDYLSVKAWSEVVETFGNDIDAALRQARLEMATESEVESFSLHRLQRLASCHALAKDVFEGLYRKAMAAYEVPERPSYRRLTPERLAA